MPPMDSNNNKSSVLKNAREAKGLTLEIVHEATKIPMDALRAIEEGYSVRILSPFYYRGFIKIYSEFLGLNVGEMYKEYGLDQAPKAASSSTVQVKPSREPAGPNLFLEQLQEWAAFVFKPKTLKLILKGIAFLVLILLLFKMAGCVAAHMHKKVEPKVRVYNDVDEERSAPVPAPAPVAVAVKHEIVQAPSDDHKVEVAVRAIKSTWIQVKTDGSVVFQMTLSKGSMENWSADSRIELSGKDIEQLDMEVNGRHIGPLGGGERRIRKVVITPEGLTVKK